MGHWRCQRQPPTPDARSPAPSPSGTASYDPSHSSCRHQPGHEPRRAPPGASQLRSGPLTPSSGEDPRPRWQTGWYLPGRRGPRPLRGAVNGPGAVSCCHLHPSGVAAGHEPLTMDRRPTVMLSRVVAGGAGPYMLKLWAHFGAGRHRRIPAPTDVITRAPRTSDHEGGRGYRRKLRAGHGLNGGPFPCRVSRQGQTGRGQRFRLRAGRGFGPVGSRGCGWRRRACGRSTWPGSSPCAATGAGAGPSRGRSGGWAAGGGAAARRW
jgi:hypothetical protein